MRLYPALPAALLLSQATPCLAAAQPDSSIIATLSLSPASARSIAVSHPHPSSPRSGGRVAISPAHDRRALPHHARSRTLIDPTNADEEITVDGGQRPEIQTYPHAGPVGQPRRVTPRQNRPPHGTQEDWGIFTHGNGESAGFGPVGRYGVAPWAEDWSFLRDVGHHDDPFDPLKYIRLNRRGDWWLTLSGETRLRNWWEEAPFLGTRGSPGSGRMTVRNLYGADLHLGPHLRLFGQLVNGNAGGWSGFGYNATYRKRLGLQQGFAELRGKLAGAKTGLLVGRQQFLDAPSYILYNRETPNVPRSWNGVRGYAIWPRIRIDLYDFVATDLRLNKAFHDRPDWSTRLHGLDITWAPPSFALGRERVSSYLDLFLIAFRLGGTAAAQHVNGTTLAGTTARQDYGFRWYGGAPSFEFSVGGLYQGGSAQADRTGRTRPVAAYAFNAIAGYRHTPSPLHPFLGLQADLYSGGSSRSGSGALGTYIAPFNPQTNYLDTTTYISPSNLVSLSPVIRLTPRKWLSLKLKAPLFWRDSTDDPIYGPSGAYALHGLHGGFVGIVPQASLTIQLDRHLTWTQYGARFIGSDGVRKAGGHSGSYYQSNFVFRF
ncbi:alginate export family protein [Swaminathania salitolerans]|uniref:Alginate export domain-containing protein n=1 Tax=Swaminathania salitolerans TaxID=182838 RepID=A0A511BW93_9PROT|nr:alginate export family protein [Swaminathania salitolerans]GBQ11040.1 hypothetical protein AA21291_0669 [Swaminathania salitolerans LMG 21291]GEL02278.1 hypothetical protein SSA02_14410 [Swaminathania salitolerans]